MQSKKQLFNLFGDITKLNNDVWDNKPGSYINTKSAALLIEEALESINDIDPRLNAREIVAVSAIHSKDTSVSEVDAFDSLLDGIYISIGELHMMNLTPEQMTDGLQVVHNANLQKAGTKDSEGKVTKPKDFVGPEAKLQAILDSRTSI